MMASRTVPPARCGASALLRRKGTFTIPGRSYGPGAAKQRSGSLCVRDMEAA